MAVHTSFQHPQFRNSLAMVLGEAIEFLAESAGDGVYLYALVVELEEAREHGAGPGAGAAGH